ncbi:MAG: asparaginase [Oscillospiraceae bacterium]
MKRILFLATGGTIACGQTAEGLTPKMSSEELISYVPRISGMCIVTAEQPFSLDSTNMSPREWCALADMISSRYDEFDGFVIAHGTDTMAYAAAALSCLIQNSAKPVVLTGSQKPISAPESDAAGNLRDAFLCACCDSLCGVIVVFGGRIIDGRCAAKVHTREFDAFRSINREDIGSVSEGGVIAARCEKPVGSAVFYDRMDTRIAVAKLTPGVPLRVCEKGLRAVIVEGFGTGGIPDYGGAEAERELSRLSANGIYVIMTTQVMCGGTDLSVYKVGSGAKQGRILEAGLMTRELCAMKAMWALAYSDSRERFGELFGRQI